MKDMKNINIVVPSVDHITKGKCRNTKGKMINVKILPHSMREYMGGVVILE